LLGEFKYQNRPLLIKDDLFEVLYELTESGYQIEKALRKIGKGICPLSFPISTQTHRMIELVNLCQGGYSGTDLVMLPYPNLSLLENPNIFFEARRIINDTKAIFQKEQESKPQQGQ